MDDHKHNQNKNKILGKRSFANMLYNSTKKELKNIDDKKFRQYCKRVIVKAKKNKNCTEIQNNICFFGDYCSRWRQCTALSDEECSRDLCNGIYRCTYQHNNDQELKESGKEACIWGPWCYFTDCLLWHPKRLVSWIGARRHDRWYDDPSSGKSVYLVDWVDIYQCQAIEYGKQCQEQMEGRYLCDKHKGWFD